MQNLRILFFLGFIWLPYLAESQVKFYEIFTNNGYDFGQGITQLEDSSYVVTGSSSSFVEGASQAFLLKIDKFGTYKWSASYGGIESEGGRRVLYKKNVGFYVAGYTNSIGKGGFDNYLVKTDESGNFLWEKSYGGTGWEKVNDATMLIDTGIMMVGLTNTNTAGNDDIYIVRTDKDGDTLWTKTLGGNGDDFATCIRQLNDSICIIGGQTYVQDSLLKKAYLLCIKTNGEIQWEHYYGNKGEYIFNDLCIVGDHINPVGSNLFPLNSELDAYSAKIDTSGAFISEFLTVTPGKESYELTTTYSAVDKIYLAYSRLLEGTTFPVGEDLNIARFNEANYGWEGLAFGITNTGDDVGGQIISTSDGGAIIVGYNTSYGAGGKNVFIAKIGINDDFPLTNGVPTTYSLVQLEEQLMQDNISMYPNPASSELFLNIPNDLSEIIISTISGQRISGITPQQINNLSVTDTEQNLCKINLDTLESGNYYISIISKTMIVNKMFTIIK